MYTPQDQRGVPADDDVDPRSRLVEIIVDQIRSQGYFVAHLGDLSEQDVVDLRWIAQLAGRVLDRPVRTRVQRSSGRPPSTITFVVVPTQARTGDEAALHKQARAKTGHLLREQRGWRS